LAVASTAKRFAEHINTNESAKAAALIDPDAIIDRGIEGLVLPKEFVTGMRKGFSGAIGKFTGELAQNVAAGGSFTLLRGRAREGKELSLYRLISSEGGLNYIELEWRSKDGLVRGIDVEPANSGEPMSASIRRAGAGVAAKNNLLDRLSGKQKAHLQGITATARFVETVGAGKLEEAKTLYRSLSPEQQKDKLTLVHWMVVGQAGTEDEYLKAMETMIRHHPQDPATLLASVDFWFIKKDFAKVRATVDKLNARVGGDPYLEVLRANSLVAEEKFAEAQKVLQGAVSREPSLEAAWYLQVDLAVAQKAHAETARILDASAKALGIDWSGIRESEDFAAFRDSKEGKAWLARLPKEPAPEAPSADSAAN
jgi:hypothetical protein